MSVGLGGTEPGEGMFKNMPGGLARIEPGEGMFKVMSVGLERIEPESTWEEACQEDSEELGQ